MQSSRLRAAALLLSLWAAHSSASIAQTVGAGISGTVTDSSGSVLPGVEVTALNHATGYTRVVISGPAGRYRLVQLPVGEYRLTVQLEGFRKETVEGLALQVGQQAVIDFSLQLGPLDQEVIVRGSSAQLELEPTRTQQSSVIDQTQIANLPVNGRQFIDFALLAPGVTIGETTSGSTDVIIEPVTKLAFAGQNIHFNFIAVDGADNISTASGVQRSSPSQEAVQEFRVINSNFELHFGRAVGGIVNIITKSGTNRFNGSVYEFFRNDALDARSILASPDASRPGETLDELRQNQFGVALGGPIVQDRSFFFANYEGQRRGESPFYNTAVLENIDAINEAKVNRYGLQPENLNLLRSRDTDNFLVRFDHLINQRHQLFLRYFFDDQRARNLSPLDDGFDMPSAFKNNSLRDQSIVGALTLTSASALTEFRGQFARRSFDFPTVSTEPALEVINLFKSGVNRGNPDFYRETRVEYLNNSTVVLGRHSLSFGHSYNFVRTTEAFPLFIPFEAQFVSPEDYINGQPAIFFYQQFDTSSNAFDTSIFAGDRFSDQVIDATKGSLDHTYTGFYIQDKWQVTPRLTLNMGLRWEFETWPSRVLDTDWNNFDPRFGFAYSFGDRRRTVLRGGIGVFHGIIPSPLLLSQLSIGGTGPLPGREQVQNGLNGLSPIFVFAATPEVNAGALQELLATGTYPGGGEFSVVRFAQEHQAPYGLQGTLSLGTEILPDTALQVSYLGVRGVHLGSFFNANQLLEPTGTLESGKDDFAAVRFDRFNAIPSFREPEFTLFFEADSRWNSIYHGLLVNLNRRFQEFFSLGISYTYSKTIDDGPNPSFVLIPENANRFDLERAVSSDDVRHRFVLNSSLRTPDSGNPLIRDWQFSTIVSLRTPHRFTRFAGFDANGDGFPVNDRVGLDSRNTFEGDSFQSVDVRLARRFPLGERLRGEFMVEAFNLFNTLNVRFFNTVYGDSVVNAPGTPGTFQDGARNRFFGTPRAIFNPRQLQFGLRISW